jgi:hypothetical protein
MNHRASFLILTAVTEVATGSLLIFVPAVVFSLLLGVGSPAPEAMVVARIAGAALVAIGAGAWLARNDERSAALRGVLVGVLIYDGIVAALLAYAGVVLGMWGIGLWPGVALHSVFAAWCIKCLLAKPPNA